MSTASLWSVNHVAWQAGPSATTNQSPHQHHQPQRLVDTMPRYDYLREYAANNIWGPSTSPETVQQARLAIDAIRNSHVVSITMLKSVASLTYHFESLMELLNNRDLIRACITRLDQREKEGTRMFDDEWGYLCFRIIVLSINASIISKYRHPLVWDTLSSMHGKEDAGESLSESVSAFLSENLYYSLPDQVIGWTSQGTSVTIISKRTASVLLDLLFKDGKGLLVILSETRLPTLTGLLFILWRYTNIVNTPECWISFTEVTRRNYLVTRADASHPIQRFQEDAHQQLEVWLSRSAPTAVDLEDARLQLSILIGRMRLEPGIGTNDLPFVLSVQYLVAFALPRVNEKFIPGVEDLFIPLLKEIFQSFWRHLKIGDISMVIRPSLLRIRLGLLIIVVNLMIEHLVGHPTNIVTFNELVRAIADLGIIDIMSKGMLLIGEHYNGSEETEKASGELLKYRRLTNSIRYVSRFEGVELDPIFEHTAIDWLKTLTHLYLKHFDSISDPLPQPEGWLDAVILFWHDDLGQSLNHPDRITNRIKSVPECSYARCHDPESTLQAALECICGRAYYCGLRCQQLDWSTYMPASHRLTCTWSEVD